MNNNAMRDETSVSHKSETLFPSFYAYIPLPTCMSVTFYSNYVLPNKLFGTAHFYEIARAQYLIACKIRCIIPFNAHTTQMCLVGKRTS